MTTPNVLVAYGTKNGSTAGIADLIALALHSEGLRADVRPARQVRDTTGYDAVVLGGALYAGRWHADARRLGIVGPNGSGRTTTVECSDGFRRADAGTVPAVRGRPAAAAGPGGRADGGDGRPRPHRR